MSTEKKLKQFENISPNVIKTLGVQALADRPNASSIYGTAGKSATELKKWFDQLAEELAKKINALHSTFSSKDIAQYIRLTFDEYNIDNLDIEHLQDFLDAVVSGKFAEKLLMVLPSQTDEELVTLQDAIFKVNKNLAEGILEAEKKLEKELNDIKQRVSRITGVDVKLEDDGGEPSGKASVTEYNGGQKITFTFSNIFKSATGAIVDLPLSRGEGTYSLAQQAPIGKTNKALSQSAIALGEDNVAGCKGYYINQIYYGDSTNKPQVRVTDSMPILSGLSISSTPLTGVPRTFAVPTYSKGSKFSLTLGNHYFHIGTIFSIDDDVITFTGRDGDDATVDIETLKSGLAETAKNNSAYLSESTFRIYIPGIDDYTLCVPTAPTKGIVSVSALGMTEGGSTIAAGIMSHAEGRDTTAGGAYAHAEGRDTLAGYTAHAEGYQSQATGQRSHAEGWYTKAQGTASHAEGRETTAQAHRSHAEGWKTKATAVDAHAEGRETEATSGRAHAEGYLSHAVGANSHAEGYDTHANGPHTHAEGNSTTAEGEQSHAEGLGTYAKSKCSHAEGFETKALEGCAHAEGDAATAEGWSSHAEGYHTLANKGSAHAEGYFTKATGDYSHSEGSNTEASGSCSHAAGLGTIASGTNQTVVGQYNEEKANALFIVGKGTGSSKSSRSNALEVLNDGTVNYKGKYRVATGEVMAVLSNSNQVVTVVLDFEPNLLVVSGKDSTNSLASALWSNGRVCFANEGFRGDAPFKNNKVAISFAYNMSGQYTYTAIGGVAGIDSSGGGIIPPSGGGTGGDSSGGSGGESGEIDLVYFSLDGETKYVEKGTLWGTWASGKEGYVIASDGRIRIGEKYIYDSNKNAVYSNKAIENNCKYQTLELLNITIDYTNYAAVETITLEEMFVRNNIVSINFRLDGNRFVDKVTGNPLLNADGTEAHPTDVCAGKTYYCNNTSKSSETTFYVVNNTNYDWEGGAYTVDQKQCHNWYQFINNFETPFTIQVQDNRVYHSEFECYLSNTPDNIDNVRSIDTLRNGHTYYLEP